MARGAESGEHYGWRCGGVWVSGGCAMLVGGTEMVGEIAYTKLLVE
jgi:hypothetical protein